MPNTTGRSVCGIGDRWLVHGLAFPLPLVPESSASLTLHMNKLAVHLQATAAKLAGPGEGGSPRRRRFAVATGFPHTAKSVCIPACRGSAAFMRCGMPFGLTLSKIAVPEFDGAIKTERVCRPCGYPKVQSFAWSR